MLALSRALTTNPSVILLDEISMGLAPLIVEELFGVVRRLASDGVTVLLVEQLAEDALDVADYVYVLSHGWVRPVGQPDDVRDFIAGSYLGETVGDAEDAKPEDAKSGDASEWVQSPDEAPGSLVVTEHGSMAHLRSCPIARGSAGAAGRDDDRLKACGICGAPGQL